MDRLDRLGKFLFVCILIIGGGYAACSIIYPTLYLRYKLTVNISDHGVIKTGSGVIEANYSTVPNIGGGAEKLPWKMRGPAVSVDLGRDGIVFILDRWSKAQPGNDGSLLSPSLTELPFVVYGRREPMRSGVIDNVRRIKAAPYSPVDVPVWAVPIMVRFRSIDEPNSIESYHATELNRIFGEGVHFAGATLELTDEPLSEVPANWPDWLKHGDPTNFITGRNPTYPIDPRKQDIGHLQIKDFLN